MKKERIKSVITPTATRVLTNNPRIHIDQRTVSSINCSCLTAEENRFLLLTLNKLQIVQGPQHKN